MARITVQNIIWESEVPYRGLLFSFELGSTCERDHFENSHYFLTLLNISSVAEAIMGLYIIIFSGAILGKPELEFPEYCCRFRIPTGFFDSFCARNNIRGTLTRTSSMG